MNDTYHFGLEWRLYLPVLKAFPVDTSEEGVFLDVPLSLRAAAQTLGRVLGHQLLIVRNKEEQRGYDDSHRSCIDFHIPFLSSISKVTGEHFHN